MICFRGVSKSFGEKMVLNQLDLSFPDQQTTCILGPSGCGKTTLLHLAAGLLKPDRGTITGFENRRKTFIFQENRLLAWLNGEENITFLGVKKERARAYLEKVGLKEDAQRRPGELSGGMQRRLVIARALAFGGDYYFFDEPLQGLDPRTAGQILTLLKEELQGKTALIITHNPEEAQALGHHFMYVDGLPFRVLSKTWEDFP
ncbi:MAG: ATP-binding cassette domain-containing protein [Dehalobacterium sp.]|jgi:ABC-type multidrug transport system ATPase subunit